MEITTLGILGGLALADSTSFGTLLIPIWLLLGAGKPRASRMAAYLGTVAFFYFVVGLLLSVGAVLFIDDIRTWFGTDAGAYALVALGVVLGLVAAVLFWRQKVAKDRAEAGGERANGGRFLRWRERVMTAEKGSVAPLMALALTATTIEVAMLLPYLIAIGILSDAGLSIPAHGGLLAAYCLVMVLPAIVLFGLRVVAHRRVEPLLQIVNNWLIRTTADLTPWILALAAYFVLRTAAEHFGGWGELVDIALR